MKKIFSTLVLTLISLNLVTMVPRAFNYDMSKVKPFDNHCFKPHAYLQYHFMPAWANVDIDNIVEYLPSWYNPPVMTVKKPVHKVTATPVGHDGPEDRQPDDTAPTGLNNSDNATAPGNTAEADYLNNPVNQELYNSCFAYDLDRNYENQHKTLKPGDLENDETMLWYAKTDRYENAVNRNRIPVDQKTNLKNKRTSNFVVPENRMIKVTAVDFEMYVGSTVAFDFEALGGPETEYCLNFLTYDYLAFNIAENEELIRASSFDCSGGDWKSYEEIEREVLVPWLKTGILNIKAKDSYGNEHVYQRLLLRHYMEYVDYPITCAELKNYLLSGVGIVLDVDVDCSGTSFSNMQTATLPTGTYLLGNGHIISNIEAENTSVYMPAGIIGTLGVRSYIGNLGFEGVSVNNLMGQAGGIFGRMEGSAVENVYVIDAEVNGDMVAGGLAGLVEGSAIRQSKSVATVSGTNALGGLVGEAVSGSIISDSVAEIQLIGGYGYYMGGLIAYLSDSEVENCSAIVEIDDGIDVGGLVGKAINSLVSYSKSSGSVYTNQYNSYEGEGIGGLIGSAKATSVTYSSSSVAVSAGENVYNTGGLIGYVNETSHVEHCSASGDVTSLFMYVGGLIGYLYNEEYDVQSTVLSNSNATGDVTGYFVVGGLIGRADATIINNVSAKGTVTSNYSNSPGSVGGLIGNFVDSELYNSFAIGNVTACTLSTVICDCVGGLVGELDGAVYDPKIENSYSLGNVVGKERTGSLLGQLPGNATFNKGYALGSVVGSGQYVGGVFGYRNQNAVVNNVYSLYPDTSSGVTVLTEAEFGEEANFVGFNFPTVWEMQNHMMCGDIRRPHLDFEPSYDPTKVCEEAQHNPQR